MEEDWRRHLAHAQAHGCEACGIKRGEILHGVIIVEPEGARRIVQSATREHTPDPTCIPLSIHFYPGSAIGGGSLETDWARHLREAHEKGCSTCGLAPGQSAEGIIELRNGAAYRIIPSGQTVAPAASPAVASAVAPATAPVAENSSTQQTGSNAPLKDAVVPQVSPKGSHDLAAFYTPVPSTLDTIGTDYKLPEFTQADPDMLKGLRVLIISADGPELPELHVPMEYVRARGADVKLAGQDWIFQWRNPAGHIVIAEWLSDRVCVKADLRLSDVLVEEYDAVFIPGGAWNPDMLRTDDQALRIVREASAKGLLVVSLCHGPQVIINAAFDAPQGQTNFPNIGVHITGTGSIRRDLKNAGFIVHDDKPTVYDETARLLTARDPNDLGPLCERMGELLKQRLAASA